MNAPLRRNRFVHETQPEPIETFVGGRELVRRLARVTEPPPMIEKDRWIEWTAVAILALALGLTVAMAFAAWGPGS